MLRTGTSAAGVHEAAPLFAALGDPVRLSLLSRLSGDGPLATCELQRNTGVSRQGITKHLQVLEQAGLVSSSRVGRDRQWRMQPQPLAAVRGCLEEISRQWDLRLARLKAFVEDGDP